VSMICGSDGIMAKPTNDNGKIANGSQGRGAGAGNEEEEEEGPPVRKNCLHWVRSPVGP
jgi:hypothetical protein